MAFRQALLVARAVIHDDGKVLLAYHRHPGRPGFWCFPGGHVEAGEGFAEAAVREIQEETGYRVELTRVIYVQDFARGPGPDAAELFFEARIVEGALRTGRESGLHRVQWVPLNRLDQLPVLPREVAEALRSGTWTRWQVPVPIPQAKTGA